MIFNSFFDVVEYACLRKMCMQPGCTTCGCMPFRNLCKDKIGFAHMCELIGAVTEKQIHNKNPEYWYEPLRIVYDVVFPDIPLDSALMTEYLRIRSELFAQRQLKREKAAARVKAEREQAAQRRAERARKAEEHRERSRIKNEEYRKKHGV